MRSTIIAAAAFAASAVAVPYANPDVVTVYNTDVQYVTNVVTVTQGGEATTEAIAEATTVAAAAETENQAKGYGGWHWPHHAHKSRKTKTRTHTATPPPAEPTTTAQPEPTPEPEPTQAAPTTTAAAAPPSYGSGSDENLTGHYNEIVVAHHNIHRRNHSAPDIEWDDGLAATAMKIAQGCVYAHDVEMDGGGYGQNIAAGVEAANVSAIITDLFYNAEIGYYGPYDQANPDMTEFEKWGHFSQIVWKETTKVGCATYHCSGGLGNVGSIVPDYFTVCNYSPPGNYGGEYGDNVLTPQGGKSVNWNYAM